jgi:hypothetical protein
MGIYRLVTRPNRKMLARLHFENPQHEIALHATCSFCLNLCCFDKFLMLFRP